MARPTRKNTLARWAVGIATGLSTIAFWAGVVNAPQPAQADNGTAQTVQSAPALSRGRSQFGRQGLSTPSFSQPQVSMPTPRFRTRGS